jgi:RNA polymerase sigma-70 factor (ECF subfamily)
MDPRLVTRAQQGDAAAFDAITQAVYGRFLQVAYRILRDRYWAEDTTQQALVTIWQKLPRLRDPDRFDAWAYRVLVNGCYKDAKRHRAEASLDVAREPVARDDYGQVSDRDLLERAFAGLTMEQRAVVVLHHYLGMTVPEVAEILDIPLGTATSRLGRGMERLRRILGAEQSSAYLSDGGSV